jgi:hypothetical protein
MTVVHIGLQNIADALDDHVVRTARGGAWHNSTVRNLLGVKKTNFSRASDLPERRGAAIGSPDPPDLDDDPAISR